MRSFFLTSLAAAVAMPLAAQNYTGPANVFFNVQTYGEVNSVNTTNATTVVFGAAILSFGPGSAQPFARPMITARSTPAILGDTNLDGRLDDGFDFDALWIPDRAPRNPSVHDIYFSVQARVDGNGILTQEVGRSAIVRITRAGTVETFLSHDQVLSAVGSTPNDFTNVTAFTVDEATGDLYLSFQDISAGSVVPFAPGQVLRIPSSAYTTGAGVVTSVIPNSAEIVLSIADVDALSALAGGLSITRIGGLEIDPTGGTYTSPTTGLSMPNLWLAPSDTTDTTVFTTAGGPATVNGLTLDSGNNLGMRVDPIAPPPVSNLDALAFQARNPTSQGPMTIEQEVQFVTTPTSISVDVSGISPGGSAFLLLAITTVPVGGFLPRVPNFGALTPFPLSSASFELFFGAGSVATLPVIADAEGFASLPLTLPALVGSFEFAWQAIDLATATLSTPGFGVIN